MPIFQITTPLTGMEIIWSSGFGNAIPMNVTAVSIDQDISANGSTSTEALTRAMFNRWLTDCNITDEIGGGAELNQQPMLRKVLAQMCLYAYCEMRGILEVAMGNCDCNCEDKQSKFLSAFANQIICANIESSCLRDKFLAWINKVCVDSSGETYETYFGSVLITEECGNAVVHNYGYEPPCESCGA